MSSKLVGLVGLVLTGSRDVQCKMKESRKACLFGRSTDEVDKKVVAENRAGWYIIK